MKTYFALFVGLISLPFFGCSGSANSPSGDSGTDSSATPDAGLTSDLGSTPDGGPRTPDAGPPTPTITCTDAEIEADPEYAEALAAVRGLRNLTAAPALYGGDGTTPTALAAGEVKTVYFDALDYRGNGTKVFAVIGIPEGASAQHPVPGVVLVHGGGGTADERWVRAWRERGYAAIAIAMEGQTATPGTAGDVFIGYWAQHDWPGPARNGAYHDSGEPITDQWMYHSVADAALANSLLRSLPFVNPDQVGVMGISWGGVITSTVLGIDTRFAFAIPVYGHGDLDNADTYMGAALSGNVFYQRVWDPMIRMKCATMPTLWYSWENDIHFPLDRFAVTYRAAPGPRMYTLVPRLGHVVDQVYSRSEAYDFAESAISGALWSEQVGVSVNGRAVTVRFRSRAELTGAKLLSTADTRRSEERVWNERDASITAAGDGIWEATATLPEGTIAWFMNAQNGNAIVSSGYQGDRGGTDISPYLSVNGAEWQNTDQARVALGDTIQFAPSPEDGAAWSWIGPGGFSSSQRILTIDDLRTNQVGEYVVTRTDDAGNICRETFTLSL